MSKKIKDDTIITLGSPYGIGYEIFLMSLEKKVFRNEIPVCIGSKKMLLLFQDALEIKKKK